PTARTYTLSLHDALPIFGTIGAKRGDETTAGPLQVALMPLEERIVEVLRRAPRRMPARLQEQSSKLFATATFAATAQVLSGWARSEEHTSELQSRSDLVC